MLKMPAPTCFKPGELPGTAIPWGCDTRVGPETFCLGLLPCIYPYNDCHVVHSRALPINIPQGGRYFSSTWTAQHAAHGFPAWLLTVEPQKRRHFFSKSYLHPYVQIHGVHPKTSYTVGICRLYPAKLSGYPIPMCPPVPTWVNLILKR